MMMLHATHPREGSICGMQQVLIYLAVSIDTPTGRYHWWVGRV